MTFSVEKKYSTHRVNEKFNIFSSGILNDWYTYRMNFNRVIKFEIT